MKKNKTLFLLQKEGVEFMKNRRVTLLGDEMGLGKTIQAIGLINENKHKRVLIICPASLKYNWDKELNDWLDHDIDHKIINKSKG
jgi:SWI/SNF-related matrix-associated actin-dependent regulator 1 of chromatin subfamily A